MIILCLEVVGEWEKEPKSKERKVKTKRTSEQNDSGKQSKKNKTGLSHEAHSTAVGLDEDVEKGQSLMTRWLNLPAA